MDNAFSAMFQFDRFRLRPQGGGLLRLDTTGAWRPVSIGSRALAVLGVLVEQRGNLVSKDEIMDAVWPGIVVEEHNLRSKSPRCATCSTKSILQRVAFKL